ncbi:MAG: hypothetical protein AB7N76_12180 [Planctomycetota bacterium]
MLERRVRVTRDQHGVRSLDRVAHAGPHPRDGQLARGLEVARPGAPLQLAQPLVAHGRGV